MFQMRRIFLFLALLSSTLTTPAFARLVIGVTPAVTPGGGDPAVLRDFETELSSRLGEPVQVRSFDSEASQLDWLIRFRELDAALVGRSLRHSLPAGTLIHLADLPSATAVTHPGVSAVRQEQLSRAFRSLLEEERGRQVLNRLAGTAKAAEKPKPEPVRRTPHPVAPASAEPAAGTPRERAPVAPKLVTTPPSKPAESAPSQSTSPPTVPSTAPPSPAAPAPPSAVQPPAPAPIKQPAAASAPTKAEPAAQTPAVAPSAELATPKRSLLLLAALAILIGIVVKVMLLMRHWEKQKKGSRVIPEPPEAETFAFLTSGEQAVTAPSAPLSSASASTVAVGNTGWQDESGAASPTLAERFLARSREAKTTASIPGASDPDSTQPNTLRVNMAANGRVNFDFRSPLPVPAQTEPATPSFVAKAPEMSAAPVPEIQSRPGRKTPRKTAGEAFPPAGDIEIVEQGRLGKIKVPALLKRCADLPRPVLLRVRSGDNETCIHFAAGQICHAYSRNWQIGEETRQWGKLGYLMVRDGVISEAQRDQALELLERQPGLRFVAALQKLEILDLEALRHILARQAKATVFALILFYSGEFRIEVDTEALPAEESIALQVDALLREASHHQAEWMAIRKVLPTLGTTLDFAPDGREKLEQVRLSVHQQLLLSQIDGQTSIGTLCSNSTMMDYEACRFLYLMVKAGVLQVATAA